MDLAGEGLIEPEHLTPAQRSLQAKLAAHVLHARGGTNTQPATEAFLAAFEREVDPDGDLDPAERSRRAEHARKAYFTKVAYRSAVVRKRTQQEHADEARRAREGLRIDHSQPSQDGEEDAR